MPAAAPNRIEPARRPRERHGVSPLTPQNSSDTAAFARGFSAVDTQAAPISNDDAMQQKAQAAALRETAKAFASPQSVTTTTEAAENRRAARRRARHHRPFRIAWTHFVCGAALLGQLVMLLWLHGRALSASHRVDKLNALIVEKQNLVERTQERIASLDASPQLNQWAFGRGWRMATHRDFDDVTKAGGVVAAQSTAGAPERMKDEGGRMNFPPQSTAGIDSNAVNAAQSTAGIDTTPQMPTNADSASKNSAPHYVGEAP